MEVTINTGIIIMNILLVILLHFFSVHSCLSVCLLPSMPDQLLSDQPNWNTSHDNLLKISLLGTLRCLWSYSKGKMKIPGEKLTRQPHTILCADQTWVTLVRGQCVNHWASWTGLQKEEYPKLLMGQEFGTCIDRDFCCKDCWWSEYCPAGCMKGFTYRLGSCVLWAIIFILGGKALLPVWTGLLGKYGWWIIHCVHGPV